MTDTTPTTFLRLLAAGDKAAALADATAALRAGSPAPAADTYAVDPASFRQIPGSPFAYWVSERVRRLFTELPAFEDHGRAIRVGLQTGDDFRFVRAWWEVPSVQIASGSADASPEFFRNRTYADQHWMPFAKGGTFSRYYADIHLVVNWANDGKEIRDFIDPKGGRPLSRPQNTEYYFRTGLTWSDRTTRLFSSRIWPRGGVFSVKGSAGFFPGAEFLALALMNTEVFNLFLSLIVGAADQAARSYQVGTIGQVPFPQPVPSTVGDHLAALAREAHDLKRDRDRDDEVTHPFTAPALVRLLHAHPTIAAALDALATEEQALQRRLSTIQAEIDDRCFLLYGFSPADRAQAEGQDTENAEGAEIRGGRGEGDEFTTEETEATEDRAEDTDDDENENAISPGRAGGLRGGTPRGARLRAGPLGTSLAADSSAGPLAAGADAESSAGPSLAAARGRLEVANLLMYALGCAFGRWDVRIGRDPTLAPALADPFAPLPVCAPGALVGPDGLPATKDAIASESWLRARPDAITLPPAGAVATPSTSADSSPSDDDVSASPSPLADSSASPSPRRERGPGGEDPVPPSASPRPPRSSAPSAFTAPSPRGGAEDPYPLPVAWEGLLTDDPEAPNDIVRRVRAVFDALFGTRADAVEAEAVAILGLRDLREYFRNPRLMWDYHVGRYSKSRRKAPIYWLLQSPRRSYAIWLYYHRLDRDLIFKALALHLLPKIAREEQRLAELAARKSQAEGAEARRLGKEIERQEALLADLREFHAALDRAAKHYLVPDLNDGVLLTIAPLWEVVPWKEAKTAWQQLLAGKYAWSSIAQQLREKSYVKA